MLKDTVKRVVGERGRQTIRRFGRLRWALKANWVRDAGAPGSVVMPVHGWSDVLQDVAASRSARSLTFKERPKSHFCTGLTVALARLPSA